MATSSVSAGQMFGRYLIEECLGEGGMGVVYRAYDTRLECEIAIKFVGTKDRAHTDPPQQLLTEARAASGLNHPNICAIHDVGEINGQPYIAMEYVAGKPLGELIGRSGLPIESVLAYGTQLSDALAHAHEHGIVHCDLKSSNIMVTPEGRLKILDFGLARRFQREETRKERASTKHETVVVAGTLHYVAPELLRGKPPNQRTDIWGAGVLLYEMSSGALPFKAEGAFELASAILRDPPPPLPAKVPPALQTIIHHCLQKDPLQRYHNTGELRSALELVQPKPARPGKKIWLATAVLVTLLAIMILSRLWPIRSIESVAVLPLLNANGDRSADYLCDGITQDLIGNLSRLPKMKVMSLNSVRPYAGRSVNATVVAHELGVHSVVLGRLLKQGDNLYLSIELVDGQDNAYLWGGSYTRTSSDLLVLVDEVSSALAQKLEPKITSEQQKLVTRRYTDNPEAYQSYLQGRYYWNKRPLGLSRGIEYFQSAIHSDSSFARAYAGLADSYAMLASYGYDLAPPAEAMPKAKAAAVRAVQLDPSLAEAHASLAYVELMYDWDWTNSEKEFREAMRLSPDYALAHHWYAHLLWATGRLAEALDQFKRAQELDPVSVIISEALGRQYYFMRDYDHAVQQYQKTLDMDARFVQAHLLLALVYQQQSKTGDASLELERAAAILKETYSLGAPQRSRSGTPEIPALIALTGRGYALSGRRQEAQAHIRKLETLAKKTYVPSFYMAGIYAALGQNEQAIASLRKAYDERYEAMLYLKSEPAMDPLRSDPRFQELVHRVGH